MPSATKSYIIIAVVAIVIIAVAGAVLLTGANSGNGSNSSNPQASTYASSSSAAATYASSYQGGPWKPWIAGGITTDTAGTSPPVSASEFNSIKTASGCDVHLLVANGTTFTLPAQSGNLSSGKSPYWDFWFVNASGFLILGDSGGTVAPLLTIVCPSFGADLKLFSPIPSNAIDSSAAVQVAYDAGGAGFIALHPNSTVSMLLEGGESLGGFGSGATWTITYQACNPTTTSSADVATFSAQINATTTTKNLVSADNTSTGCAANADITGGAGGGTTGSTVLSSDLTLGSPTASSPTAGTHAYSISVESAAAGLTWQKLEVSVDTSSTGTYVAVTNGNLTIDSLGGTPVAVYYFGNATWYPASGTSITVLDTIVLNSGTQDLTGDTLALASEESGVTGSVYGNDL
jgi:hypothetical protein